VTLLIKLQFPAIRSLYNWDAGLNPKELIYLNLAMRANVTPGVSTIDDGRFEAFSRGAEHFSASIV
jgi:hypothetical protein